MLIKYTTGCPSARPQALADNCLNFVGSCLTNNALSAKLKLLASPVNSYSNVRRGGSGPTYF